MHYVIGKPKTGKTTYLTQQFLQTGGAYFDFTGSTELLSLIPPEREVIYFNPTDTEFPIGLNVLHNTDNIPRTATAVLETIKSAWHYEGSTPLLDMYTFTAVAALCEVSDGSLLGIPFLLNDSDYREHVVQRVTNPVVKSFWSEYYESIPERERRQQVLSTLNKIYALIADPTIRNIIGQTKTTFDVEHDLVASFDPSLGQEKVSFLATLLLYSLPDFPIYLDGGHHLGPRTVQEKSNLTFCHEYLGQLVPSMREVLLGSAEVMTVFRIGGADDYRLSTDFHMAGLVETLSDLAPFEYIQKGRTVSNVQRVELIEYENYDPQKNINQSREKYASPRLHVEKSINKFLTS